MSTLARAAACGLVVVLLAGAILGFADPHGLAGSGSWSLVVGGVLWGLGAAVRRALRIPLRLGEQLLLGTVAWIFASGILLALGIASRGPLLGVAGVGLAVAVYELIERARRPPAPAPGPRPEVAHVLLGLVLLALLALTLLSMVATRGNPYDDQAAYTGFVKRLLDCGDLDEPFSFRRISAYGGQTVLHALAALRGDVEAIDLLDRGIFHAISVLLVLELAQQRRLHLSLITGVVAFVLSLWDFNANSAAIWTGFACFVGAYAFATRDDLPPRTALALTAAVCAAACTLRQNYILPAGLFVACLLWSHLRARAPSWRAAWRAERTTIALALGVAIVVVAPYMIAAWTSVGSFLYPLIQGHANPVSPLVPTAGTLIDELRFFIVVILSPEPLHVWWLLAPAMLLAKDPLDRRPWPALLIACVAGFVYLVHSFTLSDSNNLWRYAFSYMSPLATVFAVEAGANLPVRDGAASPRVRLPAIAAFVTWLAILVQIVEARANPLLRFAFGIDNIKASLISGTRKADPYPGYYRELQATVPAGESIAILLDDPFHLDYARNRIFNLDLPGTVAPAPGLPSFTTPAHWRAYLRGRGIRYLAYIDGERSSWLYRRSGWLWRMYHDDELFRFIAAHAVDALDTFGELARTSRTAFRREGFHVVDLGEAIPVEPPRGEPELIRMDRFVRRLSETELGNKTWQLASRRDVVFQVDNYGPSMIHPTPGIGPTADPTPLQLLAGTPREDPHRWLYDRTHIRVRGAGRHRLQAKLRVTPNRLSTIPTLVLHVDGVELARGHPDPAGYIVFDTPVSCDGWCDAYLVLSTVSEWWQSAEGLRVLKLLEFDWTPAP